MRRYINWIVVGVTLVVALLVFTLFSGWLSVAIGLLLVLLGGLILEGSIRQLLVESHESSYWLRSRPLSAYQPSNAHTWIVCLPGMQLDGDLMFRQYVDLLRNYGNVMVVNYPDLVFDVSRIAKQLADALIGDSSIDEVVIIGQSLGSPVGMALLELLQYSNAWPRARTNPINVVAFAAVSGFVDARAVKPPVPIWVPYLVRDSVFARWVYPPLMRLFSPQSPLEDGGNRLLADRAYRAYCNFPLAGAAAQGRAIAELPHYGFAQFMGTRLGIIETRGEDAVLHKVVARSQLRRAFDDLDVRVFEVPGPHACLVEYPTAHRAALKAFLDEVLAVGAPGRPSERSSLGRRSAPPVRLPNTSKTVAKPTASKASTTAAKKPQGSSGTGAKKVRKHGRTTSVKHRGNGKQKPPKHYR